MRIIDLMTGGLHITGDLTSNNRRRGSPLDGEMRKIMRRVLKGAKGELKSLVKARYTYKGAVSARVRASGMGGSLTVKGARNPIRRFQHKAPGRGRAMYAEVVRGQGGTIERAFKLRGRSTYFRRLTRSRLPIKSIYSTSTAEMAGKEPEVAPRLIDYIERELEGEMPRVAEALSGQLGSAMGAFI